LPVFRGTDGHGRGVQPSAKVEGEWQAVGLKLYEDDVEMTRKMKDDG